MSISSALDQDSPWPRARSTHRVIKTRAIMVVMVMALCALILVTSYLGALSVLVRDRDGSKPIRIMVDTDVDADDVFALFYLLKQKQSQFDFQAITINANGWSDAGHAINYVYDILHMMDRDDIPVGVGGEGGILPNGTIVSDVGGYFPLIDQGMSTAGRCRYRQAIPLGAGGRLDVNSNYGLRKEFLPQGSRQYVPLQQPTAQEVMRNAVSAGPITVLLMGAQTNFAIFLMNNPHLKKNVEHIYVMGGAVRPICSKNTTKPEDCGPRGNLYPQDSNPYAEFNIFSDPLAAYMVLHSGIPVTLVPLDATKTVPVSTNFFSEFERRHDTYEAEYCFRSLNSIRASWPNNNFHEEYCMWDSFMAGVAVSMMRNSKGQSDGENEFAEIEYMNITVVTSNEPYGVPDGSNPLASGLRIADVWKNRLHSGHAQTGMHDAFCTTKGKGPCQDGYTKEATGPDAVQVLVATRAKPSHSNGSSLDKEFYKSFLDVINQPEQTGRHNLRTQSSYDKRVLYKPNVHTKSVGKPVVFDMDMSAGDFLALLYLLKLPAESINLKGILVSSTGWATPATVDVVYDILHMMGRDDIPVGLGDEFAVGQSDPIFPAIGDCKYAKAIPHGSGGFLDSDTLYGLARALPSGPRRYTAENSSHPELRQPSALDVWKSVVKSLDSGSKITILANGPLTNLAKIFNSDHNSSSVIQEVYVVGGNLNDSNENGNLFTVPINQYAEFNMYLDPLAAKAAFDSELDLKILPLNMQRRVSSFGIMLDNLQSTNQTPEATFARLLLSRLWKLQREHHSYHHVDNFLGEVLGAVILSGNPKLNQTFNLKHLKVLADDEDLSRIGQTVIDEDQGKAVKVLENFSAVVYYGSFAEVLGEHKQSAVRKSGESPGKF